jgi:hypothetical protein
MPRAPGLIFMERLWVLLYQTLDFEKKLLA